MPYPGSDTYPGGPAPDLATVTDLSNFAQVTIGATDPAALFLLKVASGMVRAYLQQDINRVDNDVELFDPINSSVVELTNMPVISVSLVEITNDSGTTWTALDRSSYVLSRRMGMLQGKMGNGVSWPSDPESWRVTYTHGYDVIPSEITGVVCGVAARAYSSPVAIDMERTGQRQVKYAVEAAGFSALETMTLDKYRLGRVA